MDGIRALVEVNGLNCDINNHRHMVNTLLYGNSAFDDDINQSIFNLFETYISDSQRFYIIITHIKHIMTMYVHVIL